MPVPAVLLFLAAYDSDTERIWLLIVAGCIPGIIAWFVTTKRGLARLFRTGPALLLPAIFVWAIVSQVTCSPAGCHPDLWRRLLVYGTFAAAFMWHVALIVSNREDRIRNLLYAVVFLPCFYLYSVFAMYFPL